ncbi:MAG: site-2 protease family protein [Planctomycetaceae bacterium]|nr:site-2 protease family protein [Planctomycetaceae bacterium]
METVTLALTLSTASLVNILTVVLGLGLVIFFHELGHFAVAKWCGVQCDKFYLGFDIFGLKFWSRKWGETEYGIGVLPVGGYVKMLGQDDIDPSQLTSEEIAQNPRSYTAKSVPQRMAIISAGVIMNVITGFLFFMIAFRVGVEETPAVVGEVQVGMPAWNVGIRGGDRIAQINDRSIEDFNDLMQATALSSGPLQIKAIRPDGEVYDVTLVPDVTGTRRKIGVAPTQGLIVFENPKGMSIPSVVPGTAAAQAQPALQPGDTVTAINETPVKSFAELSDVLSRERAQSVSLTVERAAGTNETEGGQPVTIQLPAEPFRSLGLRMDIGRIAAVQAGSPAVAAGIEIGDRLASVDGQDVGKTLDPFRLPDYFAERHGQEVVVGIKRDVPGGPAEVRQVTIVPEDRGGWTAPPSFEETPLAIPAIGIAYHVQATVLTPEDGGPAQAAGIKAYDAITKLVLQRSEGAASDGIDQDISIDIGEKNLAYAFWQMQQFPDRLVQLTVQSRDSDESRVVDLTPVAATDWFLPTARGVRFLPLSQPQRAENVADAFNMGWHQTRSSIANIYLTLRNLVTQQLSVKELHGPLGIVKVASDVAQVGIAPFLLFLGFLSINLAVLNFLPIPILDGGHMVFLIWEAISRKRPSEQVVVAATLAGMAFVVTLMVLVLWLDISRIVKGTM